MLANTGTALLVMDCQKGAADRPFAGSAVGGAVAAVKAARKAKLLVCFTKIDFLKEYADVSPANRVFSELKAHGLFAPGTSQIVSELTPETNDFIFNKNRFSPFYANALNELLRARSISHLILIGISTSGVVLSAFADAIDRDFKVTILADACADSDGDLHETLMTKLFPRSATVVTVKQWEASL